MTDKNKNRKTDEDPDLYPDISNTVSATECTGLMQTVPRDEDELLAYEDLYSMEKPKKYGNKK